MRPAEITDLFAETIKSTQKHTSLPSGMTMLVSFGREIVSGFSFKDMARDPMLNIISHRYAGDYSFCAEIMVAKCSYPFDKNL